MPRRENLSEKLEQIVRCFRGDKFIMCSQDTVLGARERKMQWVLGSDLCVEIVRYCVMLQERKMQIMLCGKQQGETSCGSFEGGLVGDALHGGKRGRVCVEMMN